MGKTIACLQTVMGRVDDLGEQMEEMLPRKQSVKRGRNPRRRKVRKDLPLLIRWSKVGGGCV